MTERIQLLVYYQTHRIPATTVFVVCWLLSDLRIPQIQLASAFPAAYDPEQLLVIAAAAEKTHRHAAQILPSEKGQSFWNVAKQNLARMVAQQGGISRVREVRPLTRAGTSRSDVICGLGSDDKITAGAANDTVIGGSGNDRE